ncbi:hypothetical protein [Clostridium massiliamazoniense]|uniref:hypothetical protein n=1 Tax=Clostridium massiliamazoniense TaxID=1347366 RepID=UPI0006D7737F|nr:hypothetical protein [Clostridium massiliamazoniense]
MGEKRFKTIEGIKNTIIDNCYYLKEPILIEAIYFSGVKKDDEGYINFIRRIVIKPEKLDFKPSIIKMMVDDVIENYTELLLDI